MSEYEFPDDPIIIPERHEATDSEEVDPSPDDSVEQVECCNRMELEDRLRLVAARIRPD